MTAVLILGASTIGMAVAFSMLGYRHIDLLRRHREAKHTLNRVAGERDLLRWEKEMGRAN